MQAHAETTGQLRELEEAAARVEERRRSEDNEVAAALQEAQLSQVRANVDGPVRRTCSRVFCFLLFQALLMQERDMLREEKSKADERCARAKCTDT